MEESTSTGRVVGRRLVLPMLICCGMLLVAGGAVSYAAVHGWLPWSFNVAEDGTVTNDQGEVVGTTIKHEDGSATVVIESPSNPDAEYRVHTEEAPHGRRVMMQPAPQK